MDISVLDQGSVWAQIAPFIEARQRQIPMRFDAGHESKSVSAISASGRLDTTTYALPMGRGSGDGSATGRRDMSGGGPGGSVGPDGLSDEQRGVVKEMAARDAEVRRHETAHMVVGGQYASAPSYTYQRGPDGQRYAIGGEVQIDVSPVRDDPEATISKMEIVKAAALAPAEPSSADRRVASHADQIMARAAAEMMQVRLEERTEVDRRA